MEPESNSSQDHQMSPKSGASLFWLSILLGVVAFILIFTGEVFSEASVQIAITLITIGSITSGVAVGKKYSSTSIEKGVLLGIAMAIGYAVIALGIFFAGCLAIFASS